MKETLRHKQAFEYYYGLGDGRSYTEVARHYNVTKGAVGQWGTAFNWQQQLKQRDVKNAQTLAKKTDKAIVARDAKYIKIAEAAINVFASSLVGHVDETCPNCGYKVTVNVPKAKMDAYQFDKMVRLIKFELGESDTREEHVIRLEYVDPKPRNNQNQSEALQLAKEQQETPQFPMGRGE